MTDAADDSTASNVARSGINSSAGTRIAVVTPAFNERDRIGGLIASVVEQTVRPVRWVIVDDGSTDGTAQSAREHSASLSFVTVVERRQDHSRSFSSKARAVATGYAELLHTTFDFIACIDADVRLPPNYFSEVMRRMNEDPSIGVAGGVYRHPVKGGFAVPLTASSHVPGPSQVFRRQAFEQIGGYWPLKFGGIDTAANVAARMHGWTTRSWHDLEVEHRRHVGTGGGRHPVVAGYYKGRQDYDLGNKPIFEMAKIGRRILQRRGVRRQLAVAVGYVWGAIIRQPREVDDDFVLYIRQEQSARIRDARRRLIANRLTA